MQVHLHADLVYLFISVTGIVATPIPIHSTISRQQIGNTNLYIYIKRLANNGNINLATNIYILYNIYVQPTGKRVAVSMTSLVCFEINLWILTNNH